MVNCFRFDDVLSGLAPRKIGTVWTIFGRFGRGMMPNRREMVVRRTKRWTSFFGVIYEGKADVDSTRRCGTTGSYLIMRPHANLP